MTSACYCVFFWLQPVYYKVFKASFPSDSKYARGLFVEVAEHVGTAVTFQILTDDTKKVIYRYEVGSALDHTATNLRMDDIFDDQTTNVFVKNMQKGVSDAAKAYPNSTHKCCTDRRM